MSLTGCSAATAFVWACMSRPPGNNLCDSISFVIYQGNYRRGAVGHLRVGLISFKEDVGSSAYGSMAAVTQSIFIVICNAFIYVLTWNFWGKLVYFAEQLSSGVRWICNSSQNIAGGLMFHRGSAGSVETKGNLLGCINAAAWERTLNLQFGRVLVVRKYPSSLLGVS